MEPEHGSLYEEELEALAAVYGDAVMAHGGDGTITVAARPRTTGDASREYVGVSLLIRLPDGYPALAPAEVSLRDVFGLGEARQQALQEHVGAEATALLGEPMLCSVCEAAIAWLSDHNYPDGLCSFCLELLSGNADADSGALVDLVKLPCFHYFHWGCWAAWWTWQQAEYQRAEEQLIAEHGGDNDVVRRLLAKQLPAKRGDVYTVHCPSCRLPVSHEDLAPWMQREVPCDAATVHRSGSCSVQASLPQEVLEGVRSLQQEFTQLMRRQEANNALIDPSQRLAVPSAATGSSMEAHGNTNVLAPEQRMRQGPHAGDGASQPRRHRGRRQRPAGQQGAKQPATQSGPSQGDRHTVPSGMAPSPGQPSAHSPQEQALPEACAQAGGGRRGPASSGPRGPVAPSTGGQREQRARKGNGRPVSARHKQPGSAAQAGTTPHGQPQQRPRKPQRQALGDRRDESAAGAPPKPSSESHCR